jgi:hypothetical protein
MTHQEAIEAWLAHCSAARHTRAADAEERGLVESLKHQFARYGITPLRIYCYQRDCDWKLNLEDEYAED